MNGLKESDAAWIGLLLIVFVAIMVVVFSTPLDDLRDPDATKCLLCDGPVNF
jgi:predicted membrane protein